MQFKFIYSFQFNGTSIYQKFYCAFFVLFLCSFSWVALHGTIFETPSFNLLWQEAEILDNETLVVFDVNNVIFIHTDVILREPAEPFRIQLRKKYFSHLNPEERKKFVSRIILKDDWCTLLDRDLPKLMHLMQSKGAKIMALTAADRGRFGCIESFEDLIIQKLKNLNIDFQESSYKIPFFTLNHDSFSKGPPLYKSGVLFSDPYDKGLVLQCFLSQLNLRPKKIIFIDDTLANVESVVSAMQAQGINCLGLHYTGANQLPFEVDEEVADLQYRYLVEKEIWLGDAEARQILKR